MAHAFDVALPVGDVVDVRREGHRQRVAARAAPREELVVLTVRGRNRLGVEALAAQQRRAAERRERQEPHARSEGACGVR